MAQRRADILGAESLQHEREHAGFVRGRADESQPRDALESLGAVHEQIVLVTADVRHADAIEIVDRRAEADGIRDVSCTRLEPQRRRMVCRLLEGDVGNHVPAALPRWHHVEHFLLAEHHADAGGANTLCPENT